MVNKALFGSVPSGVPLATAVNEAGGVAYALGPEAGLAQLAATGCLSHTFYATAEAQLDQALAFANQADPEFVARCAVYARREGYMKDMPALLCAVLAARKETALLARIFPLVIDNAKMLRNFVQIIRSGRVGRKSLGSAPRNLVRSWFGSRTDDQVFRSNVGDKPSLGDVVRLSHPKPDTDSRRALYGYLTGQKHDAAKLPTLVQSYEALKAWAKAKEGDSPELPDVPFEMLTALELGEKGWRSIAERATWTQTRMNLNTFARHGLMADKSIVAMLATRLRDAALIEKARAFPYQLMMAYLAVDEKVPHEIKEALQDAMEVATRNVPAFEGQTFVAVDVSGSMSDAATGNRGSATSKVRCVDVAALFASTILRQNGSARAIAFNASPMPLSLNPRDTVLTNAQKIAAMLNGGTACSAPLVLLNAEQAKGDLFVLISDNQSWADVRVHGSPLMNEWASFRRRNPKARMVCLDIAPYATTQAVDREDILQVGGFSDNVFKIVADFAAGRLSAEHWVGTIKAIEL